MSVCEEVGNLGDFTGVRGLVGTFVVPVGEFGCPVGGLVYVYLLCVELCMEGCLCVVVRVWIMYLASLSGRLGT